MDIEAIPLQPIPMLPQHPIAGQIMLNGVVRNHDNSNQCTDSFHTKASATDESAAPGLCK